MPKSIRVSLLIAGLVVALLVILTAVAKLLNGSSSEFFGGIVVFAVGVSAIIYAAIEGFKRV
jgi:hypothetical protein